MARFTKDTLRKSGQYLMYYCPTLIGQSPRFVARFKHRGPVTLSKFKQELIKNHTVESYFDKLEAKQQAPLVILREHNPSWYESLKASWKCQFKFTF